ncbi:MAG: hypothetical protein ABEK59_10160 [Halobacteria archaeon]
MAMNWQTSDYFWTFCNFHDVQSLSFVSHARAGTIFDALLLLEDGKGDIAVSKNDKIVGELGNKLRPQWRNDPLLSRTALYIDVPNRESTLWFKKTPFSQLAVLRLTLKKLSARFL